MPRSMTGFGRAEFRNEKIEIIAEIRSLNNRYLEIGLKLPKSLNAYEFLLKDLIKKKIQRGKLAVTIVYSDLVLNSGKLILNEESVKFYYNLLKQIKNETGIKGEITLDHLLQFKELLEPQDLPEENPDIKEALTKAMNDALDSLNLIREKEAENISADIFQRLDFIEEKLQIVHEAGKNNPRKELDKLTIRINELMRTGELDRNRLEQELALLADRVDITEECIRLASHLKLFREIYSNNDEVGKQLTFLLQEMHREVNTIGSKTTIVDVSHNVIRIKEEIEKLREQVQNLE